MSKTVYPEYLEVVGPLPVGADVVTGPTKIDAIAGEPYNGASRRSREVAAWRPKLQSADVDMTKGKPISDARARDAFRNDSMILGGVNYRQDSIVGGMFLLNSKPEFKVLGFDEVWADEFQEEVETLFTLWAESTENWVDAGRANTLTGMVRLAVGIGTLAGEVVSSVEWLRDDPIRRPYSTAIQMIDLDRLSNPQGQMNTRFLRNGVVKNQYGAAQGYWFRNSHPVDFIGTAVAGQFEWTYVPARKPWGRAQVIHIFDQMRAGQTRGISDLVTALSEYKMTKDLRGVALQNAIVNATYAASLESELPAEVALAAIGGGPRGPGFEEYATQFFGAIDAFSGNSNSLMIDGVRIPHLFPGTKLQLRPAGAAGPLGSEFEQSLYRYLSLALGISYEEFSNDYSKSNYSSIKAAIAKTERAMSAKKRMFADLYATSIFRLWFEEALNSGNISTVARGKRKLFYEPLMAEAFTACEWTGASKGQIDELKETQAARLRVDSMFSTREQELSRQGRDYRKVFRQLAREKKMMEDLGLEVPKSNMINAATGGSDQQAAQADNANGNAGNGQ